MIEKMIGIDSFWDLDFTDQLVSFQGDRRMQDAMNIFRVNLFVKRICLVTTENFVIIFTDIKVVAWSVSYTPAMWPR